VAIEELLKVHDFEETMRETYALYAGSTSTRETVRAMGEASGRAAHDADPVFRLPAP
jgi:hypothetical protein